jgi:hypothetical protein
LDRFKAKPAVDDAVMRERRQARDVRERALSEERGSNAETNAAAMREKASLKATEFEEAKASAEPQAARYKACECGRHEGSPRHPTPDTQRASSENGPDPARLGYQRLRLSSGLLHAV